MNTAVKRSSLPLFAPLFLGLLAFGSPAEARNVFEGFTKAPTFNPPAGCVPREQTYGVLSRCEMELGEGRRFIALIDTAIGFFPEDAARNSVAFVDDHVAEIRAYWDDAYSSNELSFSSKNSDVAPGNAPSHGTDCREYSILIESGKAANDQVPSRVLRVEGLTCAWRVDNAKAGKQNVELFWLEAYDEYAPSNGQKPMESFDQIVQALFRSCRL